MGGGEVITFHIGQAGAQLGHETNKKYCQEHGISVSGDPDPDTLRQGLDVFFYERAEERYTPRSLFVDTQQFLPTDIQTYINSGLYVSDNMFYFPLDSGRQTAATWTYKYEYETKFEPVLERVRQLVEECENFQGFMFTHSAGGATGSGITSLLAELTKDEYKLPQVRFTTTPFLGAPKRAVAKIKEEGVIKPPPPPTEHALNRNPMFSGGPCEAYNAVYSLMDPNRMPTVLFSNDAVADFITRMMGGNKVNWGSINEVISSTIAAFTSGMRMGTKVLTSLEDFQSAMGYALPKNHLLTSSLAPILRKSGAFAPAILESLWEPQVSLTGCDIINGTFLSCRLMYRGLWEDSLENLDDARKVAQKNRRVRFLTGYKECRVEAEILSHMGSSSDRVRSVAMLSAHTALAGALEPLIEAYDLLAKNDSFRSSFPVAPPLKNPQYISPEDQPAITLDTDNKDEDPIPEFLREEVDSWTVLQQARKDLEALCHDFSEIEYSL